MYGATPWGPNRHSGEQPARERWNDRYSSGTFQPFPDAPAQWLVEHRALLSERLSESAPRRRLMWHAATGATRWLAEIGFAVDAIDVSDVAVDALRAPPRSAA